MHPVCRARSSRILPVFALLAGTLSFPLHSALSAALPVTLFGQRCQLQGELPREQLERVHAISPEQNPPVSDEKSAQLALERLRKSNNNALPAGLERYRERVIRHFEAWSQFHQGFDQSRKTGAPDRFIVGVRGFLLPHASQGFLNRAEFKSSPSTWTEATREKLQQAFENAIAARPDEEFHGALQTLGVRYDCAFDRLPQKTAGSNESEPAPLSPQTP